MVTISVVGSSSSGNGYLIESDDQILVLELGCKYQEYLPMLKYNYGFRRLTGCVSTHSHRDHFDPKTAERFYLGGINVFSNPDLAKEAENVFPIHPHTAQMIGGFRVQPFDLEHSVRNYGYVIDCPSGERILFATDCTHIPYSFKDVSIFMCEANYDIDTVIDAVTSGEDVKSGFQNHQNIEDTVRFLRESYTSNCLGVLLIHLSSTNSDEKKFIQRIKDELGIENVQAAHAGQVYEYNDDF